MDKVLEVIKNIPLTKEQREKLIKGLSEEDPIYFLKNLEAKTYARKLVDVKTFIEDENYLNLRNKVYPRIIEDLEELFDSRNNYLEAVLTGSLGWGKCLHPDTTVSVLTSALGYGNMDIEMKTIKELYEMSISKDHKDFFTLGVTDNLKVKPVKINHVLQNGKKEVYKLKLTSGKELKCTYNHPILTDKGYVWAGKLKEKDFVASPRIINIPKVKTYDTDLIKFIAYMITDGSCMSSGMSFTDNNKFTLDEFEEIYKRLFNDTPNRQDIIRNDKYSCTTIRLHKCSHYILEEFGLLNKYSKEKQIPKEFYFLPRKQILVLLDRMLRCDGNYNKNETFEYCTSSKQLAEDIVFLFLRLGIHARLYEKIVKKYPDNIYYRIQVSGNGYRKWCRLTKRKYDHKRKYNSNVDLVPIGYEEMKQFRKDVGGISKELWNKIRSTKGQYLSRAKLKKLIRLFPDCPHKYKDLAYSDIFWDRVKSVEYIGEEETYDLNIPETSNFVANNIVVHNSTTAVLAILRMVYEASCFRDPQTAYNQMPGTKLSFINCSVSLEKACKVVFHDLRKVIKNSPYFREVFPPDKMMVESMQFPHDIEIFPTTDPIGLNVIGGILDEINFMPIFERSKKGTDFDVGQNLHDALIRRMKNRFNEQGKMPGILLSISSAKYHSDFTDRMEIKAKEDKTIFFRRYAVWDTKPRSRFLSEEFKVSLGNSASMRPEIINKTILVEKIKTDGVNVTKYQEKDYDPKYLDYLKSKDCKIIDIPMDYYSDFKSDLEGSIRDHAGFSTQTVKPFFTNREKIYEATLRTRYIHPFSRKKFTNLKEYVPCYDSTTLQDDIQLIPEVLRPDKNPRFIHIDLATKKDHCGFTMGHVEGYTKVVRKNKKQEEYVEEAPIVAYDILLDIIAPHRGEIQIGDVRALILELRTYGYNIRCVSYDTFQSVDSRQILKNYGIDTDRISADSSLVPYDTLKEAYNEDRISHYAHPRLIEQLKNLERNERKNKIDHADEKIGKDISDSCAVVAFQCATKKPPNLVPPSFGIQEIPKLSNILEKYRPVENKKYDIHLNKSEEKVNSKLLQRLGILIDTEYNEDENDFIGW